MSLLNEVGWDDDLSDASVEHSLAHWTVGERFLDLPVRRHWEKLEIPRIRDFKLTDQAKDSADMIDVVVSLPLAVLCEIEKIAGDLGITCDEVIANRVGSAKEFWPNWLIRVDLLD